MSDRIIRVRGTRKNTWAYLYRHFRFHRDSADDAEVKEYRCACRKKNKCKVRIWEYSDGTIMENGEKHICTEDFDAKENEVFLGEVDRVVRGGAKLRDATNSLSRRFAHIKTKKAIEIKIRRMMPALNIPNDLTILAEFIQKYDKGRSIFQGIIEREKSKALILASRDMTDAVKSETKLVITQSKNIRPIPQGTKLMILNLVRTRGLIVSAYGAFIVILSTPSQELYEEILNHIMNLAPALKQVNTVFANEEIAPVVCTVLPNVITKTLWFDFVRHVSDLWVRNGLQNAPIEILQYSWTLGLCAEEKYKDGLEFITSKVNEQIPEFPRLAIYLHFFKQRWPLYVRDLVTPVEALQLDQRTEALTRLVAATIGSKKQNVETLAGQLYEILTNEKQLMVAFETKEKCLIKDRTNRYITSVDMNIYRTADRECRIGRAPVSSFFLKCLRPSLVKVLVKMTDIENRSDAEVRTEKQGQTRSALSNNKNRPLNFARLERTGLGLNSAVLDTSLPSTSNYEKINDEASELELSSTSVIDAECDDIEYLSTSSLNEDYSDMEIDSKSASSEHSLFEPNGLHLIPKKKTKMVKKKSSRASKNTERWKRSASTSNPTGVISTNAGEYNNDIVDETFVDDMDVLQYLIQEEAVEAL